jgi:S-adenosylmethionine-dependent methyltransferase
VMANAKIDKRFLSQNDAEKYAVYVTSPEGRLRLELAFANLQENLPVSESKSSLHALDLGCGTGATGVRLASLGIKVTLLDSSPAMLQLAQRAVVEAGVTNKVILQHGEAANVANLFPKETFDLVLCHNVLEYVDDPAAVLSAIARIMRSDSTRLGILSILVRNRAGEVFKAGILEGDLGAAERNLTADWGHESLFGGRVRLFTRECLRELLKGTSLELIAERGVRVISDYLPAKISRPDEYERIFELERKLGSRGEFASIARYTQYLVRCAGPIAKNRG